MEATEGIRRGASLVLSLELSSRQHWCGRSLGFSLKLSHMILGRKGKWPCQ